MLYRNRIYFVLIILITAVCYNLQKPDYKVSAGDLFSLRNNIQFHSQKSNPFHYIAPNLLRIDNKTRISNLSILFYEEKLGNVTKDNFYFSFSEIFSKLFRTEKAKLRAPPAII